MRWGSFILVASATAACTLFTPLDTDLTSGDDVDASGRDEGETGLRIDTSDDRASADADAGAEAGATCASGEKTLPFRAFDATPAPATGPVCSIDNVLVQDDQVAGLDRAGAEEPPLAGKSVSSCIGVEFAHPLTTITVRAKPTPMACNVACSDGCGTGHTFYVFAGPNATALTYLDSEITLTSNDLADYTKDVPSFVDARVVFVCRTAWGTSRDDIAVDAISGKCR